MLITELKKEIYFLKINIDNVNFVNDYCVKRIRDRDDTIKSLSN